MSKFKHDLLLRIVKSAKVLLMTVPFFVCWYLYDAQATAIAIKLTDGGPGNIIGTAKKSAHLCGFSMA